MTKIPAIETLVQTLQKEPQTIGRNTLSKQIGEGAFAYVFETSFDKFGRKKGALKLPKTDDARQDIETRRIILSALGNSPFSTNIIDEGTYNGVPYIVEEFREKTLAQLIKENEAQKTRPTPADIIALGKQLLTGIDYFHRLKETDPIATKTLGIDCLVHCDIKPSNILQAQDPRTGEIRWEYTDFGIRMDVEPSTTQPAEGCGKDAKRVVNTVSTASLASLQNRDPDGKLNHNIYAAPEVRKALFLEEKPPVTTTSDLWSIGAVLFAYATGTAPEWGESNLREKIKNTPQGMNDFFAKILHGDPSKRYQTAQQALTGLEQSLLDTTDSYIFGIARKSDGTYQIFKQPMSRGELNGDTITVTTPKNVTPEKIIYLPQTKNFLLIGHDQRECKNNVIAFTLDENLKQIDKEYTVLFTRNSEKPEYIETVQNPNTGDLVLRVRVKNDTFTTEHSEFWGYYRQWHDLEKTHSLPDLKIDYSAFKATKPGFFKSWKRLENPTDISLPDHRYWLSVSDGHVTVEKRCDPFKCNDAPLTINFLFGYVTQAFLIPA